MWNANYIDIMLGPRAPGPPGPKRYAGAAARSSSPDTWGGEENGQYRKHRHYRVRVPFLRGCFHAWHRSRRYPAPTFVDEPAEYEQGDRSGRDTGIGLAVQGARARPDFLGMSGHNPAVATRAVESGLIDVLMQPVSSAGSRPQHGERRPHAPQSWGTSVPAAGWPWWP